MEHQKNQHLMDLNQGRVSLEELNMEKSNIDKNNKMMQNDITEATSKMDELQQTLAEAEMQKKRLATEKADLEKEIQEGEGQIRNLSKLKTSLTTQLDDMKRLADAETRDRAVLLGKFRNLESDLENLREKIEEENAAKAEIHRQLSKAIAEGQIWKSRYTTEAVPRLEDLENARAKLMVSRRFPVGPSQFRSSCLLFGQWPWPCLAFRKLSINVCQTNSES